MTPDEELAVEKSKQSYASGGSNFTNCPAGYSYNYNPSTNSGSCVPDPQGVNVKVDGKDVNPYQTGSGGCPVGFEYIKRTDGTGSCVAKANVTTSSNAWGTTSYNKGGDSYNPAGSTICPKGTVWNTKVGKCIGVGSCPAGTKLDPINGTCDKPGGGSGGGGGTSYSKPAPAPPSPAPPPVEPPSSPMMAGISPMMIVAGVLGFAALGAVVYKVRKDRAAKGGMSPNEYDEDY
jgi:hypothetical protein